MIISCSTQHKYYHDFSFLKNDGIIIDTGFVTETPTQLRKTVFNSDDPKACWAWFGLLSPVYDLGYKHDFCSDSLFIFFEQDTLLLNNMLGSDSTLLDWFNLPDFFGIDVFKITNRISNEQHLFLSWGKDGLGNRPGRRINFVFPLSINNHIENGFGYITNTKTPESDPCLDCFTDFNRDGKTDFVQWFCTDNAPVLLFNYADNGDRNYYDSGYKNSITSVRRYSPTGP
jgi:hypothetical protein